jgi:hypothetical protein
VPPDSATLITLCFLFDKIHFPGVYLPKGDYDKELLQREIDRLAALTPKDGGTERLIGMLRFLEYRLPLDGILEYPSSREALFQLGNDKSHSKLAHAIYDVHFRPRPNWEPTFETGHTKGLPGSDEAIVYEGNFYYQATAITYAAERQLPLLDDGSSWALPFSARYKDDAQSLATLLAAESVGLVMPDLPLMTAQELVDFRIENVKELKNFRSSMLRYAKALNAQIADDPSADEVRRKTEFFVKTEIAPALHDLKRDLDNPNRPWHKRVTEGFKIVSAVGLNFLTGGLVGQTAAEGVKNAMLSELEGKGDKQEAAKHNGLYYLLRARAIKSR